MPTIRPGMMPALEIMVSTPQVRKLILENRSSDLVKALQTGEYYGMNTFDQSLAALYKSQKVDMEQVMAAASSPDALMMAIRGVTDSLEDA